MAGNTVTFHDYVCTGPFRTHTVNLRGRHLRRSAGRRRLHLEPHGITHRIAPWISCCLSPMRPLHDALAEVEDLYNNAPCGYHSIDADGFIIAMNNTALAWLGYQPEEVIGKLYVVDFLAPASLAVFAERLMIDAVDEPLDVDINDPAILPASLASGPEVTCLEQHRNGLTPGENAPCAGCRMAVRWAR